MNDELLKIKELYGEKMMHLCKDLFPTILESPNKLLNILTTHIAPSKMVYHDIINNKMEDKFRNYIYSLIYSKNDYIETPYTPFELMEQRGYTLYECKTYKDIERFRKYYRPDELICTFYDNNRLNNRHVFFAVHHDVDKIKHAIFPQREDDYGRSVISIQFNKGSLNDVAIISRYNYKVNNPNGTFGNNLDEIIPGLTKSFEKYYHLNIQQPIMNDFFVNDLNYVRADDGRLYRCNCTIKGVCYCENNIIVDHGVLENIYAKFKEKYIIMDCFIVDLQNKTIHKYDSNSANDSFIDSIHDVGIIKRIKVDNVKDNKIVTIIYDNKKEVKIILNKQNSIIGYINNYVEEIDNNFLSYAKDIRFISLEKVKIIKDYFLPNNGVVDVFLPNVETIGRYFLDTCNNSSISLPKAIRISDFFMSRNFALKKLFAPNIHHLGYRSLYENRELEELDLSNIKEIEDEVLYHNQKLRELLLSSRVLLGEDVLANNKNIDIYDMMEKHNGK